MQQLILLRHGKAQRAHEAADDESRTLIERGRREASAAGAAILAAGFMPDAALVSPATRTRETAEAALAEAPGGLVRIVPALYLAGPETLFEAAVGSGARTVWLIGHNPGLHQLVLHLLQEAHDRSRLADRLRNGFATSAAAAFGLAGDSFTAPGPQLLNAWLPPRD